MGETVLKILYAGEDEAIEINEETLHWLAATICDSCGGKIKSTVVK